MDLQFSSKLQTQMQNLGRTNGSAPPKSQDPADAILHEYFVAETGRSLFDKRRKVALDKLKQLDTQDKIAKAVEGARKGNAGSYELVSTENYSASLLVKSPVKSVNVVALTNELLRLGVDQATILKAIDASTTFAKPAESYTVSVKTT